MVHYYLFIAEPGQLSLATRFYKVAVGSSKRDENARDFLRDFAVVSNMYFTLFDYQARDFLAKIAKSIAPENVICPLDYLRFGECKVYDLFMYFSYGQPLREKSGSCKARALFRATFCPEFLSSNISKNQASHLPSLETYKTYVYGK